MRKFTLILTLVIITANSAVFAGSVDYLSNQSAKFVMNPASVARTEGADIAAYNPAGTAFFAEGLYFDVSNQMLFKSFEAKENRTFGTFGLENSFKQSEPTWFIPNLYAVYNFGQMGPGKLAAFLQAGIIAGEGKLKWGDGTIGSTGFILGNYSDIITEVNTQAGSSLLNPASSPAGSTTSFEASSTYYAIGLGAAYSLLEDKISFALGMKYVMAKRTGKINGAINVEIDPGTGTYVPLAVKIADEYECDANGITPVFGFDAKPTKDLTIGLRYEMETKLNFKYKQKKRTADSGDSTVDAGVAEALPNFGGLKAKQNLPAILSFGAEQKILPELTVGLAVTIFFMPEANIDQIVNGQAVKTDGFGNAQETSLSVGYKVMPELKLGLGIMYTNQNVRKDFVKNNAYLLATSANPILDSLNVGLGATYEIMPGLDATLALNWEHYFPMSINAPFGAAGDLKVDYKKEVYGVSIGVAYKL